MTGERLILEPSRSDVLRFRPRTSDDVSLADRQLSHDVHPYQGEEAFARETDDDHRVRMRINIAALIFAVALTIAGVWLAISIADLHKAQDCVLMGRQNCAEVPARAPPSSSIGRSSTRIGGTDLAALAAFLKPSSYPGHKNPLQG